VSTASDSDVVRRAFLGMGSNMGDRARHLADAIEPLTGVVAVSPVYETEPVGGPSQGAFLNVVVELGTPLSPRQLLGVAHRLESAAGRVRSEHWGPRPLDVDVLLVGDLVVDEPDLVVPHPRMWQRRFVLAPLADLAPELVPEHLLASAEGRVSVVGPLELPRRRRGGQPRTQG
jgi:2-amino-4-hydroxy-6-hydroxymethyldihydropteridine diphosphokinase